MTEERSAVVTARLNELARKNKAEGLNEAELAERALLREEYLAGFRKSLTSQLDLIHYVDDKGNVEKLKKKGE